MSTLGKFAHYAVDFSLLAGFLAGIRRSTGLEPNVDLITNPEINKYTKKYLNFGESLLDKSTALMGQSSYFVRK